MASLQFHAAVLLSVGLIAGCGGDRRGGAGADTTGAAAMPADSSATTSGAPAPADTVSTAAPGAADTAGRPSTARADTGKPAGASDSATQRATRPSGVAKKTIAARSRSAHADAGKPSAQASRDTARVAKAESTNSAATPAPAPTPQQQDTAKQDTGKTQDTSQASAQPDQPLRDAYHQAPRDTVDQATYDGWKQFNLNCARCHGEDALGTTIAPHLIMSLKPDGPINTKELFVQTVCAGRPAKGMPSWCALGLGMDKINDIYLYVKGRSDAKIAPGRPAVKPGG